jgi:hypothetical protein
MHKTHLTAFDSSLPKFALLFMILCKYLRYAAAPFGSIINMGVIMDV